MFKGLNDEQIKKSREEHGSNIITEAPPETFWDKFKGGFDDPMIKLLLAVAVIMGIISIFGESSWTELVGIAISVLLVTGISAKTEVASDSAFRKLKDNIEKDVCKVHRNGKVVEVLMDDLVVGDIVILQNGDKVPADGLLVDGYISVDNSALNGESEECKKTAIPQGFKYDGNAKITGQTFVDKHSLFRGAVVVDGEGLMEIKKVGMKTMMGEMAEDMNSEEVESPLKVKLSKLAGDISKFGYIGSVVIALALLGHKVIVAGGFADYFANGAIAVVGDVLNAIMLAVVIVVMAVPEGLPLMIAIVLMQNTAKMLDKNVLVRKAIGIETAGSLNILFSDKTGTITKGKLEVVEFFGGDIKNSYKDGNKVKELMSLAIGKNTAAMFDAEGKVIGGNATDKALMSFLTEAEYKKIENTTVKESQGFNSTNKYSAAQIGDVTYYKGAPERLVSKATKMVDENGNVVAIDKKKIDEKIDALAKKAMRVLSFAYSESGLVKDTLPEDLVIIGFVAIRDDVRPEARDAIKEVQNAGVQVVMITGDRKETAIAIAKDAGLLTTDGDYSINGDGEVALTSAELNELSDDEVKAIIPRLRVVARALPTDKSRMVRLSQELNLVCGMTGDGVNDAPALKRADVGFAMGSGTDVAKEAGSIVILDDNFKSIENAILYGRTIYNNILKFIKFQLTINVSAVAICAIAPFFGIEEPLKITHILWINLVMDGLGALALGSEPALDSYMKEKPKSRTQSIVSKKMMSQILVAGAWVTVISFAFLKMPFFKDMFGVGATYNEAAHMTAYFSMFVLAAVANGLNVRGEGLKLFEHIKENPGFLKVMGIIVLVQIVLTFIGGELFSCAPFGIQGWVAIILLALTIIPVDMIRKMITKK